MKWVLFMIYKDNNSLLSNDTKIIRNKTVGDLQVGAIYNLENKII